MFENRCKKKKDGRHDTVAKKSERNRDKHADAEFSEKYKTNIRKSRG